MSRNERNASEKIVPIRHNKTVIISIMIFSFLFAILMFWTFGFILNRISQENQKIIMVLVSLERIVVYFAPGLIFALIWLFHQKIKDGVIHIVSFFRAYLLFEGICCFGYNIFGTVIYMFALDYLNCDIVNPFTEVGAILFTIATFTSILIGDKTIFSNDISIYKKIFG